MNELLKNLKSAANVKLTENGAVAYESTMSKVYDMFAFGAAYRNRTDEDCILLFQEAYVENPSLAMKCLFFIVDCRGGQGERRFFRVCFQWLAKKYPEEAKKYLELIPTYRRFDDLIYSTIDTPLRKDMLEIIKEQIALDYESAKSGTAASLLAKWMPSENASSKETKRVAQIIRNYLGMTAKDYRKMLSTIRESLRVLETLMSANRWDEIEFSKIPSKAGLIYKNAFARRDMIARKYEEFAKSTETKVNAGQLYPYEVVEKALNGISYWSENCTLDEVDRAMINKYWENLPDYFDGADKNILCMVDTSGSMYGNPINVAISLGLYCAEHSKGDFANHYISFASEPQLIETRGIDFVDKVTRIYQTNLVDNTDLDKAFALLKRQALKSESAKASLPESLVIISDMEIDEATGSWYRGTTSWSEDKIQSQMEKLRAEWAEDGLVLPRLVYWSVNSRNNTILDKGPDVSFVSGCSPVLFEQVLKGVSGYQLMLDKLLSSRYEAVV